MLSNEEKVKLIDALGSKVRQFNCPMCHNKKFVMADGYFNNATSTDFTSISIGGTSIPTIAIICENCGFVSQHALGILGFLPKDKENGEPK